MNWKADVRRSLVDPEGLRVVRAPALAALAMSAGLNVSPVSLSNTITRFAAELVAEGAFRKMARGLFLNCLASPRPEPAEVASTIREGAVVSLQTVLGDSGVLNNTTHWVTSVCPRSFGDHGVGDTIAGGVEFTFTGIAPRIILAGDESDRLDMYPYPRATPEAALIHWLHVGLSPHTKMGMPPDELDLECFDLDRLDRLADAAGLRAETEEILERARRLAGDESSATNGASILGF